MLSQILSKGVGYVQGPVCFKEAARELGSRAEWPGVAGVQRVHINNGCAASRGKDEKHVTIRDVAHFF